MKSYLISVIGCDDDTTFYMQLTDREAKLVKLLAEKCTEASTYTCMPTMMIQEQEEQAD